MQEEKGSSSTSRRCKEDHKDALNLQACGRFSSKISPRSPSTGGQFAFPSAPESDILDFLPTIEQ